MATQTEAGKAFEFAILTAALKKISETHKVIVERDRSYDVALQCFNLFSPLGQQHYLKSSEDAIKHIIDLEPFITDPQLTEHVLVIKLSKDSSGTKGDVRDILMIRPTHNWEIGISAKNNHRAVKHSRLSEKIDFGKEWLGHNCSENYFSEIKPVFSKLRWFKSKNVLWRDLEEKHKKFTSLF